MLTTPLCPMHTTSLNTELARLSEDISLPNDNGNLNSDYLWFKELEVSTDPEALDHLVDDVYKNSIGTRARKSDTEKHWRHCYLVVLNLSLASLCRRWLLVSMSKNDYANDFWLRDIGLSYRHMKDIIDHLRENNEIEYRSGKKYKKQSLRTRIFPTNKLREKLLKLALTIEQPIKPPYLSINKPEARYNSIVNVLPNDHPDKLRLIEVNNYLKAQNWALKSPVRLVYTNNIINGGRLYTSYQNIPSRKYKIRQHTLINDLPIREVDFNANHLRINLAVLSNQDAGDTPYEDIAELVNNINRQQVKTFITIAMGADNRDKAINACRLDSINFKTFELIEKAALKRFPKLALFCGFGVQAQSLEGQILLDIMVEGAKQDITVLPVHDAIAVNDSYTSWSEEQMTEKWMRHVNRSGASVKPRLKTG